MSKERKKHRIGTLGDAQETAIAALMLVARIRAAVGDPEGKLMQDELIEHCRKISEDAQRANQADPTNEPALTTCEAWEYAMQEVQDDDGTWADAARHMRDIATSLECDNVRLRAAIAAGIDEARSLDVNTDSLVDGILSPALLPNAQAEGAEASRRAS